ncbi:MAG: lysozyme inhibitor LprI family protein [Silvibacterium sp.]
MRLIKFSAVLVLAIATTCFAEDKCAADARRSLADLGNCLRLERQQSELTLNRVYGDLLDRLQGEFAKTKDDVERQYIRSQIDNLKVAELSWSTYRDNECKAESQMYEGGTMQPRILDDCVRSATERRIKEIKEVYQQYLASEPE